MKKSFIAMSLLGVLAFSTIGFAQTTAPKGQTTATLEEKKPAVKEGEKLEIGKLMDRSLYARRPSMLQWNREISTPTCIYLENDSVKTFNVKKGDGFLFDFNQLISDSIIPAKSHFPSILAIKGNCVLLSLRNKAVLYDYSEGKILATLELPEGSANMDLSSNMEDIAFTQANNLYIAGNRNQIQLSGYPDTGMMVGHPVHRFEFGITKGTFWSNNGKSLAYYVMDESMVQQYPITSYLQDPTQINSIRYPEAGRKMHQVRVEVYHKETNKTLQLEPYFKPEDTYITSVTWTPDDQQILLGLLSRNQKEFTMVCYDAYTGKPSHVVFEEKHDIYVEPETGPVFVPGTRDQFIWFSERKGYNHIYLYNTQGKCLKAVTPDNEEWMVTSFVGFTPNGRTAYFMATKASPLQENLYSVDMRNGKIQRLTKEDGVHTVNMHPSGLYFIDSYTSATMGRCTQIINHKGQVLKILMKDQDPMARYVCPEYRIYRFKAADGKTDLYGRMILPHDFDSTHQYPVLVYVYGGPHAQLITNTYNYGGGTFLRFLAQEGYIVWTVDSRGSSMRGFDFETAPHRRLGVVEAADQMKGIDFIQSLPYVDASRIGVDGWSFGGFMTLNLKTLYPDVFKVATAGGPVIDWAWYEVMYGERYMGTPQDNPEGYQWANLLNRVDSIRGKVMLIQGGLDPVVLPKHSITFIQKCIQKKIPVDFFLYPNHEHNVIGPQRDHLWEKLFNYYQQNLR